LNKALRIFHLRECGNGKAILMRRTEEEDTGGEKKKKNFRKGGRGGKDVDIS